MASTRLASTRPFVSWYRARGLCQALAVFALVKVMNILSDLQKWYESNCDEEWEHYFGLEIGTLDNPGWSVKIDLDHTNLEGREFEKIERHESDGLWIICSVEENKFCGYGDPTRLEELLTVFLNWAKAQNEDWLKPSDPLSDEEREKLEDDQFFASLGDEIEGEKCRQEGCGEDRIRNSVMCRKHHFEMITKRPAPERAS